MNKPLLAQLREEFRNKRDEIIREANQEYRIAMKEISALQRRLGHKGDKQFKLAIYERLGVEPPTGDCKDLTVADSVHLVLSEGKAMTLKELAVEIQGRGCHPLSAIKSLVTNIRNALHYHTDRYEMVGGCRWALKGK